MQSEVESNHTNILNITSTYKQHIAMYQSIPVHIIFYALVNTCI